MFFDQLAIKLNIQKPEDWLEVHSKTVLKERGSVFLHKLHNGSLIKGKYDPHWIWGLYWRFYRNSVAS
jgi:hypothetical protein